MGGKGSKEGMIKFSGVQIMTPKKCMVKIGEVNQIVPNGPHFHSDLYTMGRLYMSQEGIDRENIEWERGREIGLWWLEGSL